MTKEFISFLLCLLQQWNHFPSRRHTQSQLEQIKWQFEILFFFVRNKRSNQYNKPIHQFRWGPTIQKISGNDFSRRCTSQATVLEKCTGMEIYHGTMHVKHGLAFFCCTSNRLDFLHEAFNTNLISCPRELILDGDKIPCCCGNFRGCNFCQSTLKPFVLNVL